LTYQAYTAYVAAQTWFDRNTDFKLGFWILIFIRMKISNSLVDLARKTFYQSIETSYAENLRKRFVVRFWVKIKVSGFTQQIVAAPIALHWFLNFLINHALAIKFKNH